MPSLYEVKQQLRDIDALSRFLGRKEINALPKILWEGEKIEGLIQGWYKGKAGVLVATDRRLIFVEKGWLFGLTIEDFPYDKVSTVQYEQGILFGRVKIFAAGNEAVIERVNNVAARSFANKIREKMSPPPNGNGPNGASADPVSQLERLALLKEKGILTEEEFQQQKSRILNQ